MARHKVDQRDVPLETAARRMGLKPAVFTEHLPALLDRGFPKPDQTTGLYDLQAIDEWMTERHRPAAGRARDARDVVGERLARM